MDDDDNPINKALNLAAYTPASDNSAISTLIYAAKNDSAKEDFTFARANIREVVENGNDAIAKLAVIADQSQNLRAFEVLAKLMDSMVAANKQLLELQKDITAIEKANVPHDEDAKKHVTNNNLFVGSTSELSKIIQSMRDKDQ
jgi:hypothetical protein